MDEMKAIVTEWTEQGGQAKIGWGRVRRSKHGRGERRT